MANYKLTQTGTQLQADLNKIESTQGNPTLAGTETELTGVQIGSNVYKVGVTTSTLSAMFSYNSTTGVLTINL